MRTHTTKDGKRIKLRDMTDSHLTATIRLFERRAKEGVTIRSGGGNCAEDMWYDEDTLYGDDALEELGYADYVKERDRRISKWMRGIRMNDADALLAALKSYRCQHTLDQDGGGIDLVDALSPGDTIAQGLLELELLAEHLDAAVGGE